MPRLHVYAMGGITAAGIYGILYKSLYLPYTTHQREMELVLEAEKFVSQQFLQRAERLTREIADAPQSQLPSLFATSYTLNQEIENAASQVTLPKQLYLSRLNSIKERCGRLPGRNSLSNSETIRSQVAYSIFNFVFYILPKYFFSSLLLSVALQRFVTKFLLHHLLLIDVKVNDHRQSTQLLEYAQNKPKPSLALEDHSSQYESKNKTSRLTVFRDVPLGSNKATLGGDDDNDNDMTSSSNDNNNNDAYNNYISNSGGNRRSDEITADDEFDDFATKVEKDKEKEREAVAVAHVSHWIEELSIRHALLETGDYDKEYFQHNLMFRYPEFDDEQQSEQDDEKKKNKNNNNNNNSNIANTKENYFINQRQNNNNNNKQKQLLKTLSTDFYGHGYPWFDQKVIEEFDQTQLTVPVVAVKGIDSILHVEKIKGKEEQEELVAAVDPESTTTKKTKPSEADLLRRRRILLDQSRIRREEEEAERTKMVKDMLYSGENNNKNNINEKNDDDGFEILSSGKNHQEHNNDGESDNKNNNAKDFIASKYEGCGMLTEIDKNDEDFDRLKNESKELKRRSTVTVNIGKLCVAPELFNVILQEWNGQ